MLGVLLDRQFGRQSSPRPWANRRRLASGLCAAYLLLLFVAGLSTPAAAQRTINLSMPATINEPAAGGSVDLPITLSLSSGVSRGNHEVRITLRSQGRINWVQIVAGMTIDANQKESTYIIFRIFHTPGDQSGETITVEISEVPDDPLSNHGLALGTSTATATIINYTPPPPKPKVSIADASATEGLAVAFTVSVSPTHTKAMTLSYATADGTATTADSDYTGTSSGSVTIPANAPSASISVATGNDTKDESDETFTVTLSGAPTDVILTRATATGTINDNDEPPPPVVSIAGGSAITEGGTATFSLSATPKPPASITVNVNVEQTGNFAANGQTGTRQVTIGTDGTAA